jgi:beta-lactamase class A
MARAYNTAMASPSGKVIVLLSLAACATPSALTGARGNTPANGDSLAGLGAIEGASKGVLGVEVVQLGSGKHLSWRGGETFPMASTFKVAVALAVVRAVDRGAVKLGEILHVAPGDLRPGMGDGLAERWPNGVDLSVADLTAAMVEQSDNTACDAILRRVGGPAVVTAMLRELGVTGLRVDRSELELGRDVDAEGAAFSSDPRDHTTPAAMADLLEKIVSGNAASRTGTETLLRWLTATTTGRARLKAGLPAGARLAHKTGSYGDDDGSNATNDVGVVTLADGSRVIVVAYLRDAKAPLADRERTLADVAREVLAGGSYSSSAGQKSVPGSDGSWK